MSSLPTLGELADVVRSKNAGPFHYTFDIIFSDPQLFARVLASGQVTRERFAQSYGLDPDAVQWTVYEPALGFKATIRRPFASGQPEDGDVYGCQQHGPLLAWEIALEPEPMAAPTRAQLDALAANQGIRLPDGLLAGAVAAHAQLRAELEELRQVPLSFIDLVEPATVTAWIERSGHSAPAPTPAPGRAG